MMGGGFMMVFFAALMVLGLLALGVLLVRLLGGGPPRASQSAGSALSARSEGPAGSAVTSPARQALDERYARGELDTEEYRERRQVLEGREGDG